MSQLEPLQEVYDNQYSIDAPQLLDRMLHLSLFMYSLAGYPGLPTTHFLISLVPSHCPVFGCVQYCVSDTVGGTVSNQKLDGGKTWE